MYKSQVERFVERCFIRSSVCNIFKLSEDKQANEKIGYINYSDRKYNWEIEFHQSLLVIRSCFFVGDIFYKSIKECEPARLNQVNEKIECVKIYDMDYVRTLTELDVQNHYESQNGVVIDCCSKQAKINLSTKKIDMTIEVISNLCDFLSRVRKTRAWENFNE